MLLEINELALMYERFKAENPQVRIREVSKRLETSEAQLVALGINENVTKLRPDFEGLLSEIPSLGKVMALTRNNEVVHERKGVYAHFSTTPHAWLFVGKDIDLRIFPNVWAFAFAVREGSLEQARWSFQFFAKDGSAVHKIYLEKESDLTTFHEMVEKYKAPEQHAALEIENKIALEVKELMDEEIDVHGFKDAWLNLQDTHDFFGMLRKFKVTRTQALRLAPSAYFAKKMPNDLLRRSLIAASESGVSMMVFVGNAGMIQIHTGPVINIIEHGPWINVLDPEFNLHVLENAIAETWVVRKPTTDGEVTSIELFNSEGELICTLFGERKPGKPELESWRNLVSNL
jgi:putative hemin transport protein